VATDADRLRAERLFVEAGKSMSAVASDIGCARSTVYEWRNEGDWDSKRKELSDKIQQAVREVSDPVAAAIAASHRLLSRAEGLAIAAGIAINLDAENRDRLAALKLIGTFDGWAVVEAIADDGRAKRLVIERPGG